MPEFPKFFKFFSNIKQSRSQFFHFAAVLFHWDMGHTIRTNHSEWSNHDPETQ